ncbi:dynein regulatory complex protein 8-like [Diabrotica virgifera virgifera]|uniref:Dynein regulatory complex protein 8-like n=1 Tax=Diabrotica virgifera virgifera TaxID=50390 RepID=A0A6P7F9Z9_DIAVI|nr:dynein regulatory complex protein 8-like [Diabrotica virgifera virgifera]
MEDEEEIDVPIENELEQRIADAFSVFDQYQTKIIDLKDVASVIRGLGCCPTEAEIQDIINGLKNSKWPGCVHLVNFLPKVFTFISDHKYEPASPEQLMEAFRSLDPKGLGYLTKDEMAEIMFTDGEPFTQDELDEMFEIAIDPLTNTVNYEYYINQIMYEPVGENSVYTLADRIEAEKPPPPPPQRSMSEYFRRVASQMNL